MGRSHESLVVLEIAAIGKGHEGATLVGKMVEDDESQGW